MKLFILFRLTSLGMVLFSVSLASLPVIAAEPSSLDLYPASDEEKRDLLKWNLHTLVNAYETGSHTNEVWDASAKAALTEFALMRSKCPDTNAQPLKVIGINAAQAIYLGCDDPMLKYLKLRYTSAKTVDEEMLAREYAQIARQMNASTYPPIRKFFADARVLSHVNLIRTNVQLIVSLRTETMPRFINHLNATLYDKTVPVREAYEVADDTLSIMSENTNNYKFAYDWIKPFFENWPNEYLTWLLKGRANVELAWIARGHGYANTITEDGAILFEGRLAVAQDCLEHAWIVGPKDPAIARLMMSVMLGRGGDRKQMDLWFNRAMALDTNDFQACNVMLYYLEPKWYGSDEEQLAFGRQCVESKEWGGKVPLILVQAHESIDERLNKSDQLGYWTNAIVWKDITTSFDRFIELNPDKKQICQNYALFAYRAGDWKKFLELLQKDSSRNYQLFGGKRQLDEMVQLAQQHVAEQNRRVDGQN